MPRCALGLDGVDRRVSAVGAGCGPRLVERHEQVESSTVSQSSCGPVSTVGRVWTRKRGGGRGLHGALPDRGRPRARRRGRAEGAQPLRQARRPLALPRCAVIPAPLSQSDLTGGGALALSGGDLTLCRRAVERGAWPGRGGGRVPPGPVAGCCQAARARARVSAVLPGPCGGVAHWRGSPPRVDFEFSA